MTEKSATQLIATHSTSSKSSLSEIRSEGSNRIDSVTVDLSISCPKFSPTFPEENIFRREIHANSLWMPILEPLNSVPLSLSISRTFEKSEMGHEIYVTDLDVHINSTRNRKRARGSMMVDPSNSNMVLFPEMVSPISNQIVQPKLFLTDGPSQREQGHGFHVGPSLADKDISVDEQCKSVSQSAVFCN